LRVQRLASIALACMAFGCAHTAQITGTVQFKDGTPIKGVEVHLVDSHAAVFVMREIKKGTTVTDKDGRFRFDKVRYSHMMELKVFGQECRWWGNGWAILQRDATPPEEYEVTISLLPDDCKH